MHLTSGVAGREQQIIDLFTDTFTMSEGADEGRVIGDLVRALLLTPTADIRVYTAEQAGKMIGASIFSRLSFRQDDRTVFLLSPMAVAPDQQRRGVGQTLLKHALSQLLVDGVDIAMTYGDPNYYARVGFRQITEDQAPAPLPLSMPHGWLAQSLTGKDLTALAGPSTCVEALNRPAIW